MGLRHAAILSAVLAQLVYPGGVSAWAEEQSAFPLTGIFAGKVKADGKQKQAADLSGIACDKASGFPRRCVVVDDDSQHYQFADLTDKGLAAGEIVQVTTAKDGDKALDFDGEAVAFADGKFYVLGSHGRPRDVEQKLSPAVIEKRRQVASVIYRIDPNRAAPQFDVSDKLTAVLKEIGKISEYWDRTLDQNGLTLEGMAVKAQTLYIGLRAPVLGEAHRAAVVSVGLDVIFGGKSGSGTLTELDLGGRGIRDLTAYGDGFLILAGPSADPDSTLQINDGDYLVYYWKIGQLPQALGSVAGFKFEDDGKTKWAKPEAIAAFDSSAADSLRLLTLFDGPKANGAGRLVAVKSPPSQ